MKLSKDLVDRIITESKQSEDYIIDLRRDFHKHPEICYEEVRTTSRIRQECSAAGVSPITPGTTGVICSLSGKKEKTGSSCVGLRADIDGLALTEENDCCYASTIPGRMHACGHDAHTAMLLGALKILSKLRNEFCGEIRFVFQPAEEGGGGAKKLIDGGFLQGVETMIGLHVWSNLEAGTFSTRKGPFFAAANKFSIFIHGKGGHAAHPNASIDPTAVGTDIYNAIQKLVSREISPFEPTVISITHTGGSDVHNIIPDKIEMKGTARGFNEKSYSYMMDRMREIVTLYSRAWRCKGEFIADDSYPVLLNNPEIVDQCKPIAQLLGTVGEADLTLGGEDFAFYGPISKAAMYLLGIGNKEKGLTYPHHHPRFDVDESVLWKGTAFYALSALNSLLEIQK